MKIIFLNVLNGQIWEKLLDFVVKESETTDIFCFQEADLKLVEKLSKHLPDFGVKTHVKKYIDPWFFEQAIFVRKGIKVLDYVPDFLNVGAGMFIKFEMNGKAVNLCNIHGIAFPGDKLDCEGRFSQSQQILEFLSDRKENTIFGGDFNLMPDTKSIKMIEESGFINLIRKFDIRQTRNKVAWDFFKDKEGFVKQYFADYCFVSPGIDVVNFEVPYNEVSDHLPQILEFSLDSA